MRFFWQLLVAMMVLSGATVAFGAPFSLSGTATITGTANPAHPSVFDLSSDTSGTFGAVGLGFGTPFDYNQLTNLSADYNRQLGAFGGGSPRFSIRLDADNNGVISAGDANVFVYFGTHPNFNDVTAFDTWFNSGNLMTGASIDTSSLVGGNFYDTVANSYALFGTMDVLRISLVVDGGWNGNDRFLFDNIMVNAQLFQAPEPASMLAWSLIAGVGAVGYRFRKRKAVSA